MKLTRDISLWAGQQHAAEIEEQATIEFERDEAEDLVKIAIRLADEPTLQAVMDILTPAVIAPALEAALAIHEAQEQSDIELIRDAVRACVKILQEAIGE